MEGVVKRKVRLRNVCSTTVGEPEAFQEMLCDSMNGHTGKEIK
jgi:hypothetical protein